MKHHYIKLIKIKKEDFLGNQNLFMKKLIKNKKRLLDQLIKGLLVRIIKTNPT